MVDLTLHEPGWWLLRKADAKVVEYVRRSIPILYRRFDPDLSGWLIHEKHIDNVRQMAHNTSVPATDDDPYRVLYLHPNAPPAIIKAVWRELAKSLHPDHGGDIEQFKRVQAAYYKITKG